MGKSLSIKNCEKFNSTKTKKESHKKRGVFCLLANLKITFPILFLAIGVLGLAYVFQVNKLAILGQEINEKENLLQELQGENEELKIQIAQEKSSYHFESERKRLNLVNSEQVSFVEIEKEKEVAIAK